MTIQSAANFASIKNTVLKPTAEDVGSVVAIIGSYEAGKTITDEVPVLSSNSAYTGSVYGFGSMLQRLHLGLEKGSRGQVPVYIVPQAETGGAAAAVGEVDFTITTVGAGTLAMYIGGERIPVTTTASMTEEELCDACVAAINAVVQCNLGAAKHAVTFELDLTSKTLGTYGNSVLIAFNLQAGDETPAGISWVITQPVGGAGLPDIQDALDGLGTYDNANNIEITALVHGYGQDSDTIAAIRDYVGVGDDLVGCYSKVVARPFYSLTGDIVAGSAGLTAAAVYGNARKTDRANGWVPLPGGYTHPSEVGAEAIGNIERRANEISAISHGGTQMVGCVPGADADQWTNAEVNRDTAVNAGIGTTKVDGVNVFLSDTITFYHSDAIPENSNIYREISNIRKIRNILNSLKVTFNGPPFTGSFIVEDANTISSALARAYAVSEDVVRSILYSLIDAWAKKGWIYETAYAKSVLEIDIRAATDGFDSVIKAILSGVGKVWDNQVQADISTSILQ